MDTAPMLRCERIDRVGVITLDRPEVRNALCLAMRECLRDALAAMDADETIAVVVVMGSDRCFASGADLRTLSEWDHRDAATSTALRAAWEQLARSSKPVIAAVAGHALGAGCELAMMCDFIIAADNARFGQPEIRVGTIPGSGGTQRLARLVGKGKAMEMVLTGRAIDAHEAERCGLVARVVPLERWREEALQVAADIAAQSRPVVRLAREAVHHALESGLSAGLAHERRLFESTFALEDRREGMRAFLDKRPPEFRHR